MKPLCREFFGVVLVITTGLPGCGGGTSSTSDSSGFVSGADRNKMLGSLTSTEVDGVCQAFDSFFDEVVTVDFLCQLGTFFNLVEEEEKPDAQMCQLSIRSCLAQSDLVAELRDALAGCPREVFSDPTCSATVAEWEECVAELRENYVGFGEQLSCSLFDSTSIDELRALLENGPNPPKCKAIEARCPALFE